MSTTSIEWTDATWNPIAGCSKEHTGCKNCYAERMSGRKLPHFENYNHVTTDGHWNGIVTTQRTRFPIPLGMSGKKIFVSSMSDLGHPQFDDNTLMIIYGIMLASWENLFQHLTKRPGRIGEFKRKYKPEDCLRTAEAFLGLKPSTLFINDWHKVGNIVEYVSVSDQTTWDKYVWLNRMIPSRYRGVSLEPMIGPVNMNLLHIDHVIVGGESGPGARPCAVEWIDDIVYQCHTAKVPVFVKQLGQRPVVENANTYDLNYGKPWGKGIAGAHVKLKSRKGGEPAEWPSRLRIRQPLGTLFEV